LNRTNRAFRIDVGRSQVVLFTVPFGCIVPNVWLNAVPVLALNRL